MKSLKFIFFALVGVLILTGCENFEDLSNNGNRNSKIKSADNFEYDLVYRWAPVHHQDVDVTGSHGLKGKADYITAVNFDNDWNAKNNWQNIENHSAKAHCYYSVVETGSHWYIIYAFFHPRDWTDNWFLYYWDEHENDLEGLLAIVEKDGSLYGKLQAMVTVFHSDFYSYNMSGGSIQGNNEDVDGTITMEKFDGEHHPVTAQEAKGHGLKAYPYVKIRGGDGVVYYPSYAGIAEQPEHANDRNVSYKLVNIFEPDGLWEQRFNKDLFTSPTGSFQKSEGNGSANPPWNWDDGDDGATYRGEMATDPVNLVKIYFKGFDSFSDTYTSNRYVQ